MEGNHLLAQEDLLLHRNVIIFLYRQIMIFLRGMILTLFAFGYILVQNKVVVFSQKIITECKQSYTFYNTHLSLSLYIYIYIYVKRTY